MKLRNLLLYFLVLPYFTFAQNNALPNAAELKLDLKKLDVLGSVLYIAAHPDDENTRLLSYLAKEKLVRTAYLSLTRGDGGQNLIGNEQSEELGLIRTQELLAARRTDGAIQFFTRANDFGFSKTADETFNIWNKKEILGDVVYIIRKFKPDVIITRFPNDARAGHGHHQASSILAQEAFKAAADPKQFPEQLREVSVWQTKRILWNTYNFGSANTTANDQLKIDVGLFNNLLGKGYGEIAAESRSMHKSQGFGSARQRGSSLEYFSSWQGELPQKDLFEGIDLSWGRLQIKTDIAKDITSIQDKFNIEKPGLIVEDLIKLHQKIAALPDSHYKDIKLEEVKKLILHCSGTWVEAQAKQALNAQNTTVEFNLNAVTQYPNVKITAFNQKTDDLNINQLYSARSQTQISKITQPYWLVNQHPIGQYVLNKQADILQPDGPKAHTIQVKLSFNNYSLDYEIPVIYKYTDQVRGEVYQPLVIAPPVTINPEDKVLLFPNQGEKEIRVRLKAFKENLNGELIPELPKNWKISPEKQSFNFKNMGEELNLIFKVTPSTTDERVTLKFTAQIANEAYQKAYHEIKYEHIPAISYFSEAEVKLTKLDIKTTGNKLIGYINGAGDLIPESLKQIGYQVNILTEKEMLTGDLSAYDAIITGVRAFNTNEKLPFARQNLLKYIENGGTLLVQYNVNRPLLTTEIGPYPFNITRDRVTEENAKVFFLKPKSKVLNYPNKLSAKDFDGWIQERGLYFADNADSRYEQPLGMNDTGEKQTSGALLVTSYGKGKFIYTGLSFFRELPAGVAGAYRLFVNLISK
jgi:LmbE family N-acetylglucosaminyl deacetylase